MEDPMAADSGIKIQDRQRPVKRPSLDRDRAQPIPGRSGMTEHRFTPSIPATGRRLSIVNDEFVEEDIDDLLDDVEHDFSLLTRARKFSAFTEEIVSNLLERF